MAKQSKDATKETCTYRDSQSDKHDILIVDLNGTTFYLDQRYQLVMDCVPVDFAQRIEEIDRLYGRNDAQVKALINQTIADGGARHPAIAYFLSMALINYGELQSARKLVQDVYRSHSDDLLARCAYVNLLFFEKKLHEIPDVFNGSFDLSKTTDRRELALVEFVKFMDHAATYYYLQNDRRFENYGAILMKVAPDHDDTRKFIRRMLEDLQTNDFDA